MSINKDDNEFEGKLKITNFSSKEDLLQKINSYCQKYATEENESLYDIEKEKSNLIILNFHKNSELASYINRKLKLLQIENSDFSDLNFNLIIKVINPRNEKYKQEKKEREKSEEKEKSNEIKNKRRQNNSYIKDVYNVDTKNNPRLNKLLNKSLNFNKKNMNKYMSQKIIK